MCKGFADGRLLVFRKSVLASVPPTLNMTTLQELHGGRLVFKMWHSPQRRAHSSQTLATASQMEGGSFSKRGSRLSAAHIRFEIIAIVSRIE
eukprot:6914114-Pyramimonas_sp.AAC.1